ncbi:MAG: FAD-dependent oxidoreductase [Bacillota bacterium]|nr:FAD-dependent oxidoreductase [Bacillota bacterium]
MQVTLKERILDIAESVDVLVVGGGPAGIGAAISAARNGSTTMLLEKRGFLGGNITASYVETCNYFFKGTPFHAEGIYAEIEEKYHAKYGSDDIRQDAPPRFSSEYLKVFLDDFVKAAGVKLKLHSFVNQVVVENNEIQAVIIQTKKGPVAIGTKIVIDTTGDADVAFSAGVPFEQGRERDGLCQPGTVSFRVAGADVKKLTQNGDLLKVHGRTFHEDYRAGKTNLTCKRQDLPFGRVTAGGQISYINYSCEYEIDPTDVDDLTRGEVKCRQYIMEFYQYMKEHFEGLENIEITSIAPEIGFRDSRRIIGEYHLTIEDMEANRQFDDVIAVYPRFYDMLAPDANMDGDGSVEGKGYKGHIFVPVEGNRSFQIPYKTMLPVNINNMLVAGRCLSADHVAQSGVRAISLCMMTGEAAGAAAALANSKGISPKQIDVKELQKVLRTQNIYLPE